MVKDVQHFADLKLENGRLTHAPSHFTLPYGGQGWEASLILEALVLREEPG